METGINQSCGREEVMTYTTAQEGTSELVCSMYQPKGWPECCQSTLKKGKKTLYLSVVAEKGLFWDGTVFWVVWIGKMLCKYCFTVLFASGFKDNFQSIFPSFKVKCSTKSQRRLSLQNPTSNVLGATLFSFLV